MNKYFKKIFSFFLNLYFSLFSNIFFLKRYLSLRKQKKQIKKQGGEMIIKKNEYLGGSDIIIEFPVDDLDFSDDEQ